MAKKGKEAAEVGWSVSRFSGGCPSLLALLGPGGGIGGGPWEKIVGNSLILDTTRPIPGTPDESDSSLNGARIVLVITGVCPVWAWGPGVGRLGPRRVFCR